MENNVLLRCCGNCQWSMTKEAIDELIDEGMYNEEEANIPMPGDCCLGRDISQNFICDSHAYREDVLEIKCFYEDKYKGPGYFITKEYKGHITKFIKIYRNSNGEEYSYSICAFTQKPIILDDTHSLELTLSKYENEELYYALLPFVQSLGDKIIWGNNKSFIAVDSYGDRICLTFTGFKNKNQTNSNYIDITIDSKENPQIHKLISDILYRNLAVITKNQANSKTTAKVRKLSNQYK